MASRSEPPRPPGYGRSGSVAGMVAGNVAGLFAGLLVAPLMARALTPSGRGIVAIIGVLDEASTQLFNLGLPIAIGYFAKERVYSAGQLLRACIQFGLLALPVACIAAGLLLVGPLRSFSPATKAAAFLLIGFSPLVNTLAFSLRQLLLAKRDYRTARILPVIQSWSRLVVVVGAYATSRLSVVVAILAVPLSFHTASVYAWRRTKERLEPGASLPRLLRFGLPAAPGALANLATTRLDQLLIAPFLGTHQLGLYAVAVATNYLLVGVGSALAQGSVGGVGAADLGNPAAPAAAHVRRAWVASIALALVLGMTILTAMTVIFGDAYAGARGAALILLPGSVALAVNLVAQQVAVSLGLPRIGSQSQLVGLAITVVALPLVVPAFGIAGAAAVSTVAYVVRLSATLFLLRRANLIGMSPASRLGLADIQRFSSRILAPRGLGAHDGD